MPTWRFLKCSPWKSALAVLNFLNKSEWLWFVGFSSLQFRNYTFILFIKIYLDWSNAVFLLEFRQKFRVLSRLAPKFDWQATKSHATAVWHAMFVRAWYIATSMFLTGTGQLACSALLFSQTNWGIHEIKDSLIWLIFNQRKGRFFAVRSANKRCRPRSQVQLLTPVRKMSSMMPKKRESVRNPKFESNVRLWQVGNLETLIGSRPLYYDHMLLRSVLACQVSEWLSLPQALHFVPYQAREFVLFH